VTDVSLAAGRIPIIPSERVRPARRPLLYLVGQLTAGGQERQLIYLVRGLLERGHRPELAVWNYAETDAFASAIHALGVPVHPLGSDGRARKIARLRALVARLQPGVLHSYSFYTNFIAAVAAAGRPTVGVGSIRDELFAQRRASGPLVGSLSALWPRTKICNSQRVADRLGTRGRLLAGQVLVVRNGLDVSTFVCDPRLPERTHVVGAGRLVPQKRWDLLVSAVQRVTAAGHDVHVTVAGEGPLGGELEALARRLGVADRVRFMGLSRDVPQLLAGASFLVLASDYEGCPNVVMEAMACGRAVVATEAGDVPYLVEDGVTGFVVRPGDLDGLVARMTALARSPELVARMGRAGRQRAERELGVARLVEQTLAAYRRAGWRDG